MESASRLVLYPTSYMTARQQVIHAKEGYKRILIRVSVLTLTSLPQPVETKVVVQASFLGLRSVHKQLMKYIRFSAYG